jgi:hypothetical protein
MVDAEDAVAHRDDWYSRDLRQEEARSHPGHRYQRGEAVEIRNADADRVSGDLVPLPLDREGEGSGAHHTEVEPSVCVLPNILGVYNQIFFEGLLDAGMEFIAKTGINRSQVTWQIGWRRNVPDNGVAAPGAANDQILVEGSFQRA